MNKSILVHSTNGNAFVIPIDNIGYAEGSTLVFKNKIEFQSEKFILAIYAKESPEEINNLINEP